MSDSIRLADHIWKDGESLVGRLEQLSRSGMQAVVFYQEVADGMLAVSGGASVGFWQTEITSVDSDRESNTAAFSLLARAGIDVVSADQSALAQCFADACPAPIATWTTANQLSATQRVTDNTVIGLNIRFDQPSDSQAGRALCELAEAVLQIGSGIYLRDKYSQLQKSTNESNTQDLWTSHLYSGVTLRESFAAIADAVSQATGMDRVGMLRQRKRGCELIATSTQPMVDRRAQQIRLMEDLVTATTSTSDAFSFDVGSAREVAPEIRQPLDRYLGASGVKSIRIESICDESGERCAALIAESFQNATDDCDTRLDSVRDRCFHAAQLAIQRDQQTWSQIGFAGAANAVAQHSTSRKAIAMLGMSVFAFALLYLIPAELKLPVEGRLVPAQRQRIFAPVDSTIARVLVENGQGVKKGDVLIELTSSKLDLLHEQIAGDLATTQTQLGVVSATRGDTPTQDGNVAADQQVLKTKIAGLKKQLELVNQQLADLQITSPIDGTVDRWDLQQSLPSKPVRHGEHLVDVAATDQGWTVQLDIPDHESRYVIERQTNQPCDVSMRLRSDPANEFSATVDRVAKTAMLSDTGKPIVHASASMPVKRGNDAFRSGATVQAYIHCGKRSLGVIWFRGIVQWARQRGWL